MHTQGVVVVTSKSLMTAAGRMRPMVVGDREAVAHRKGTESDPMQYRQLDEGLAVVVVVALRKTIHSSRDRVDCRANCCAADDCSMMVENDHLTSALAEGDTGEGRSAEVENARGSVLAGEVDLGAMVAAHRSKSGRDRGWMHCLAKHCTRPKDHSSGEVDNVTSSSTEPASHRNAVSVAEAPPASFVPPYICVRVVSVRNLSKENLRARSSCKSAFPHHTSSFGSCKYGIPSSCGY